MESTLKNENLTGENHDGVHPNLPLKFLTATSIIGDFVVNKKDEIIGKIKDIMIDVRIGKIEYVVIERSTFFGMNAKLFAVNYEDLQIRPGKQVFEYLGDEKVITEGEGFDKNHWPKTNSHVYNSPNVDGFMGASVGGNV